MVPLVAPEVRRTLAVLTQRGATLTPQERQMRDKAVALIRQRLGTA
jgi:hypothetical protein